MTDLKVYVCKKSLASIQLLLTKLVDVSVDSENWEIRVPVLPKFPGPLAPLPGRNLLRVPVKPKSGTLPCDAQCGYPPIVDDTSDWITWQWSRQPGEGGNTPWKMNPEITVKHPDHCQWAATWVMLYGPARLGAQGGIHQVTTPDGGGDIPEDFEDVHPGGYEASTDVTQNSIVPGMKVANVIDYFNGKNTVKVAADETYWCTACFNGGTVTAVNGSYGDPAITYDVSIEGRTIECTPSDFVEWEVGDWVFVLIPGNNCADKDRNPSECRSANIGTGAVSTAIIIPMKIGVDGA
jgi:hypothetical protein